MYQKTVRVHTKFYCIQKLKQLEKRGRGWWGERVPVATDATVFGYVVVAREAFVPSETIDVNEGAGEIPWRKPAAFTAEPTLSCISFGFGVNLYTIEIGNKIAVLRTNS